MPTEQNIPQLDIAPDALVMKDAVLSGKITFGSGTIVHPRAHINARDGEIVFGTNNIVEELASIEYSGEPNGVMTIGNDNLFEVKAVCRAARVGDNNVFAVESCVDGDVEVTDFCRIGIKCHVALPRVLQPMTEIYFADNLRRHSEKMVVEKPVSQRSQAEFLRRLLPRFAYALQNAPKPAS